LVVSLQSSVISQTASDLGFARAIGCGRRSAPERCRAAQAVLAEAWRLAT